MSQRIDKLRVKKYEEQLVLTDFPTKKDVTGMIIFIYTIRFNNKPFEDQ